MKNILIFNDISGLGNCSLAANLPVFAKLGHNSMPVVTGTFSRQTGFEHYTFQRNENLLKCTEDILSCRSADAIYVGFCVDSNLLAEVEKALVADYIFVDPILGDNGKLYGIFNQQYVEAMKKVVRHAHCISPNLTEACILADVDYNALVAHKQEAGFLAICGKALSGLLQKSGAQSAVVTGVECGEVIGNIVLEQNSVHYVTNERVPINYSGTGDIFSSVLLGTLLRGANLVESTQVAANFVCKAAQNTQCTDRRFGVDFAKVLHLL